MRVTKAKDTLRDAGHVACVPYARHYVSEQCILGCEVDEWSAARRRE